MILRKLRAPIKKIEGTLLGIVRQYISGMYSQFKLRTGAVKELTPQRRGGVCVCVKVLGLILKGMTCEVSWKTTAWLECGVWRLLSVGNPK